MGGRASLVVSVEEAASWIKDGDTIGIGGFVTTNKPMAVLRRLMKERRKDLTVVAPPSSIEVDMMAGLGMLKSLLTPYVGAEALAPVGPFFGKLAGRAFQVEEVDLGMVIAFLRAQVYGLPFMPARGPAGTSLPELNRRVKWMDDPFGGPRLLAVPPIELDVGIIVAAQADQYGNVQHLGATFIDSLVAQAAKKVIVQVERLVSNEEIKRDPLNTTLPCEFVDAVVVAPFGCHPLSGQGFYGLDEGGVKEYIRAARSAAEGSPETWNNYLIRYVDGPENHAAYLQEVGFERILGLGLENGEVSAR